MVLDLSAAWDQSSDEEISQEVQSLLDDVSADNYTFLFHATGSCNWLLFG